MHTRTLHFAQLLPPPRDELFAFFAAAENLGRITPPWLHFRILTPTPIAMRPGALIDYRLRLHGVPLRWRTEIAEWEPPVRFVDVQLRGPYRLWVHTHTFTATPAGTLCTDEIRYAVPGGRLVDRLFVRPQVARIFAHRRQASTRCSAPPREQRKPVLPPQPSHTPGQPSDRSGATAR